MVLETQLTQVFLKKVFLSLLIGALLGLEREYTKHQEVVGLRTFSLISLLGGITSIFAQDIINNHYVVLIGLIAVSAFSLLLYFEAVREPESPGFTTNIAIILAYLLGASAGYGLFLESVFLSVVIAVVLYSRERMHRIVDQLSKKEVTDLLEFTVILGIIYPLLPPESVEVMGIALPLQTVWGLIVIISLINFASFLGSRYLKTRYEVPLISLFGGLISSSGTTASLATHFKENKKIKKTITSGFLLMTGALLIKTLGVASIFNPASAKYLLPALIAGIVPLVALAYYKHVKSEEKEDMEIESPFHIKKAAKYGLAILVLIMVMEIAQEITSELVILTAFIAGTVTSTSMTLSLISLSLGGTITLSTFVIGIIMAAIGSYIGDYIILALGDAKEIIKSTWIQITVSAALMLSIFFLMIHYLGI